MARGLCLGIACTLILLSACHREPPNDPAKMSFFITSVQAGSGGNIGGLPGADAHCQRLAAAAGSARRQWRAYLSAAPENGQPAINARDRIGAGPWFNIKGVEVAANVADLHGAGNKLGPGVSLFETGNTPRFYPHDMMTGSNPDGTLAPGDSTCRNWTSTNGQAMLGHADRQGSCCGENARSWNSAHPAKGCSIADLRTTGGGGLFYCFAADE
jgi:hypothetical protein